MIVTWLLGMFWRRSPSSNLKTHTHKSHRSRLADSRLVKSDKKRSNNNNKNGMIEFPYPTLPASFPIVNIKGATAPIACLTSKAPSRWCTSTVPRYHMPERSSPWMVRKQQKTWQAPHGTPPKLFLFVFGWDVMAPNDVRVRG